MINSIIFYFATQAKNHEIDFDANLSITEDMAMNDLELSILFGNLLENAIEACIEQQHAKRRVIIKGKGDAHSLIVTIDNTCDNEIERNKKGELLTTKPDGNGIGVNSAKKIVERYNGFFSADKKDELFCVSFMLNF